VATIEVITELSPRLDEVQRLWRSHSKTLGQFYKGAFIERAQNGEIIVAIEDDAVVGYALYFTSTRHQRVRLTHLCVDKSHRGKGIARQLMDRLRSDTRRYRGISLYCRRDYDEWNLWPKFGFVAVSEKVGRGKDAHGLTHFWLQHPHKSLFSEVGNGEERLKVVIDANIFYDLDDPDRNGAIETQGLTADWIQPLVQLCVSDELHNEIHRNNDSGVRQDRLAKAHNYDCLDSNADEFLRANADVRRLLGTPTTEQSESDQRHLARTIASDATVFVTRDQPILNVADTLYEAHGLSVVRPSELVARFEELRNEQDYQRARLAESELRFRRVSTISSLPTGQFVATGERERGLVEQLNTAFAHPDRYECHIVETSDGRPMAIHVVEKTDRRMVVPLFRLSKHVVNTRLAPTLARTLLSGIVQNSLQSQLLVVEITDARLSDVAVAALNLTGFFKSGSTWLKVSIPEPLAVEDVPKRIQTIAGNAGIDASGVAHIVDVVSEDSFRCDAAAVLEMEHTLWPCKILGCEVTNYVIPIRPRWATDLFDAGLAKSTLWGAETELALNPDSVYYRATRPPMKAVQGRILWYVSNDDDIHGTMRIRACSQLRDVVTGGPKELFRRFRRLGVYEWRHVLETAGSVDGELMALQFSDTELFPSPVSWNAAQTILRQYGIKSTFVSPTEICESAFVNLYLSGSTPRN